ncbi:MAG: LysM domain-containing protein, partial [Bacillota bacterium]
MRFCWLRALLFTTAVILSAAGLMVVAGMAYPQLQYHAVYVEDDFLGYTPDAGWIHDLLEEMLFARALETGFQVSIQEDIHIVTMSSYDPPDPTPPDVLECQLREDLNLVAHAVGIQVDGELVSVVANERDARNILDGIVADHIEMRESGTRTTVRSCEILEDIEFIPMPADPDIIDDPETVEHLLLRGTDQLVVHEVQRGETAWGIAETAGLTVSELETANPGSDISRVFPGDELHLVVADPHITLRSEEEEWYIRYVPNKVETRTDSSL